MTHFVIDGVVRRSGQSEASGSTNSIPTDRPTYLAILDQPRSAWMWEVELRPSVERF